MTDAKLKRVERKIRAAVEGGLDEGWELIKGWMRQPDRDGCACALGMVVRDVPLKKSDPADTNFLYKVAGKRLGLDEAEITAVWQAFDSERSSSTEFIGLEDPDLRTMAARIREDYYDVK